MSLSYSTSGSYISLELAYKFNLSLIEGTLS